MSTDAQRRKNQRKAAKRIADVRLFLSKVKAAPCVDCGPGESNGGDGV